VEFSDEEILIGCLKQNRKYQQALYQRFCRKMMSVCLRYAKDDMQAEDFLQDGFIKVFTKLDQFKSEGSLEGWVRRVIVNTALQTLRSNKNSPITADDIDDIRPIGANDDTIERMSADELHCIIKKLPTGYRTIFNLYVVEEFTHKEIAEQLGISEGTSKSQLARARMLLQKMIKKNEIISDKHNAAAAIAR